MKALQQPPTTLSGSRGNVSRYPLESPPDAAHISYKPEMVGRQYGHVVIISPEKRWKNESACYVLVKCAGCGRVQWTLLSNLTRGISAGCQNCSQPPPLYPHWLYKRASAAKQRCTNPRCPEYRNYGGRGIRFAFDSPKAMAEWIVLNLGIPGREYELDRIDNDGAYAPGNLRWIDRAGNAGNRRLTVLPHWDPAEWPYARSVVIRKLSAGMTRDDVLREAAEAVAQKRKN